MCSVIVMFEVYVLMLMVDIVQVNPWYFDYIQLKCVKVMIHDLSLLKHFDFSRLEISV